MKSSRWAKAAVVSFAVAVSGLAMAAIQPASAERVAGEGSVPQAFLLKLEERSTTRAFVSERPDGLGEARSAARDQKAEIREAQSEVIEELPAEADVLYRTHSVLAGIGVQAEPGDEETLEAIPGVAAVYPIAPKKPSNSYAVPFQGGVDAWENTGFLGQGMVIAVVDSGVDYTHAGFGGPGTVQAYQDAHAAETEVADPALFPSDKVIGGFDLVGDDYDTNPASENYQPVAHPDPNPLDCGGHGTHVAGIAAGTGVNADGSTFAGPYDNSTDYEALKIGPGMAPEASIIAIRVFSCSGSSNVITQAIDRAADPNGDGDPSDGADVINLSLGSDFGGIEDGDSVAANAASAAGITVVAAAGNSGDQADITGSPGDAASVISVANSVDAASKNDGAAVTIDGNSETFAVTRSDEYDWENDPDLSGTVVAAPETNETACTPYPEDTFAGEVVIVKWHDAAPECGSIVRGNNLEAAGAGGFIFGSDAETFSAGIYGSDTIPGVVMVASGTDAIRDALEDDLEVTVDGTSVNSVTSSFPEDDDKLAVSSSRGVHSTGNVKPDVAAVGSTVFSVAVGKGSEGVSNSGTSMASPMVAGLAALVREAHPAWSPLQVKAAIMNTASHDLFVNGADDPGSAIYGPVRVGAGRIDAPDAVTNEVLAYNPVGGSVSVSFGPVAAGGPVSLERQITVDNRTLSTRTYDVSYDPLSEVPGAEITVSPAQVTVGPRGKATVTVKLEIEDPTELTKAIDPTVDRLAPSGYPRETLAEAMGRVLLAPTVGTVELRVPVYSSPRPASSMTQPKSLTLSRKAADPDAATQVADMELSGTGVGLADGQNGVGDGDPANDIRSVFAGFELQAKSGPAPQCSAEITTTCYRVPEERFADVRLVGYTSDYPQEQDVESAFGYFAIAVDRPWSVPSDKAQLQVEIDVDGDNEIDLSLYNARNEGEDLFLSALYDPDKPAGQRVVDTQLLNGRFGSTDTAAFDSDVMVLPVSLEVLGDYGIDPDNPRINYGVSTYGYSSRPVDLIGLDPGNDHLQDPLSANLFRPGLAVTTQSGLGPLLVDRPAVPFKVARDIESYEADRGEGLMMVHFHNQLGDKAQVVSLNRAASTTTLAVSEGSLRATVSALGAGLPVPSGQVTFFVDGAEVGKAQVTGGTATLAFEVPAGAVRDVRAEYAGDPDFEPSADGVGRGDPRITARVVASSAKNARGWYRAAEVSVVFECVSATEIKGGCPGEVALGDDGRGQSVSRTITTVDGGRATGGVSGIDIDRTPPTIRIRGVKRGAAYRKVRRARCVAADKTSGVQSCSIRWKRKGKRVTYTAVATDKAGNRKTLKLRVRLRR